MFEGIGRKRRKVGGHSRRPGEGKDLPENGVKHCVIQAPVEVGKRANGQRGGGRRRGRAGSAHGGSRGELVTGQRGVEG